MSSLPANWLSPPDAKRQKSDPESPPDLLRVVFLLDITGSMSSQIAGVKEMVKKFCEGEQDLQRFRRPLAISIMTYTENSKRGYVSHFTSTNMRELAAYVSDIQLSRPPDHRNENACGDDAPENVLEGLATMSSKVPAGDVLCFVITDAPPHPKTSQTPTAQNERRALQAALGLDEVDQYEVLDEVLAARGGRLILVPVLYGVTGRDLHFYAQAAALSGGLVLKAAGHAQASTLAASLGTVVASVGSGEVRGTLEGFEALDPQHLETVDSEESASSAAAAALRPVGSEAALHGLIQAVQTVAGRKWSKKIKGVGAALALASTQLVQATARKALGKKDVDLRALADELAAHLEAADKASLEKVVAELDPTLEALTAPPAAGKVEELGLPACIISLETTEEAVDAEEHTDMQGLMSVCLRLLLARLADVQLPLDADGNPDFQDAWSARVRAVGPSTLSAFTAMQARDDEGKYQDPQLQTRRAYSTAVAFAHPRDAFGLAMFRLISATPLLDLVTTYLLSGQAKVYRNIWTGTAASVLAVVLAEAGQKGHFSEAGWETARCLATSLRAHARLPAAAVVAKLAEQGHLNPADAPAKLIAAVLCGYEAGRVKDLPQALKLLAAEQVTAEIMVHARMHPEEADPFAQGWLDASAMIRVPEKIDPLLAQHPLEAGAPLADGWLAAANLEAHPAYGASKRTQEAFAALVTADLHGPSPPLAAVDEAAHRAIFAESLLLGKRTGRYACSDGVHTPLAPAPAINDLARRALEAHFAPQLRALAASRTSALRADMLREASRIAATDRAACSRELAAVRRELFGKTYRLGRADVPDLLALLNDDRIPSLGVAAVLDAWTSEPPSYLRRADGVRARFDGDLLADVEAALAAAERCMRDVPNRHGHTAANPYPGADGWTEAYAEQRLKDAKGNARVRSYVEQMKKYTAFAVTLRDLEDDKVVAAVKKLYFEDANRLDDLKEAVEILKGASKRKTAAEALEAFLELPASRVNMCKLRKPFRTSKRGEPTIWYSFGEKDGYEFVPTTR